MQEMEIAIITTAPPPVTEGSQNHEGYVKPVPPWGIVSVPLDTFDCHLLIIGLPILPLSLPNYSNKVL